VTNPETIEKWRAEFCAWFNVSHGFYEFYLMEGDKYKSQEVQIAWEAWLAARESVVIALPNTQWAECMQEDVLYPLEVESAIESQGYRVRSEQ
jgi:hypothetical protein